MGYRLGVDLGTTYTAAAIERGGRTEVVTLGDRAAQVPSVLFLREDGGVVVGEPAERRGVAEPERLVREFKRRLGDQTAIIVGGSPYSPQSLSAKLLRWTVDHVVELQGSAPEAVVVTYPANCGSFRRELLGPAVALAGRPGAD